MRVLAGVFLTLFMLWVVASCSINKEEFDSRKATELSTKNKSITIYKDEDRGVTCWIFSNVRNDRSGLSCIPNNQLKTGGDV